MKNFLVYIWRLAGLIAVATGGGAELQRGAGDVTTRTSPCMTCELPNSIQVNSDSVSLCILGINVVFRRQGVLSQTLPLAGEATVELAASTMGECAKLAAEAGLAAFEFNTKCLAYNSSISSKTCDTSCDRFIFVADNSCSKEPRLVPLDEAPWKPGPYNDTREYRLEKLIYLDESTLFEPPFPRKLYDPDNYQQGASYVMLQNGSTFTLAYADVDLSTCLYYVGDAGLPTLVTPMNFNHYLVTYYFMENCGGTIILPPLSTVDDQAKEYPSMIYSHRGFGCSEFPGKTYVDCTVNIKFDDGYYVSLAFYGLQGRFSGCDGFSVTVEEGGVETEICERNALSLISGGNYAVTLRGSASDTRLGFYFFIYYLS